MLYYTDLFMRIHHHTTISGLPGRSGIIGKVKFATFFRMENDSYKICRENGVMTAMKHVVVLGDGMADYRMPQLGHRTPLQYARKPNIDFLAANGETGIVRTIPEGVDPGSDTANLSVMGYDPGNIIPAGLRWRL